MSDTTVMVELEAAEALAYEATVTRYQPMLACGAFGALARAAIELRQLCTTTRLDTVPLTASAFVQLPGEVLCQVPGAAVLDLAPCNRGMGAAVSRSVGSSLVALQWAWLGAMLRWIWQ